MWSQRVILGPRGFNGLSVLVLQNPSSESLLVPSVRFLGETTDSVSFFSPNPVLFICARAKSIFFRRMGDLFLAYDSRSTRTEG